MRHPTTHRRALICAWRRSLLVFGLVLALVGVAAPLRAETLAAPSGGQPIPLGERVACAAPTGGWSLVPGGRSVRPPLNESAVGKSVELDVAPDAAKCATNRTSVTLAVTA